MSRLIDDWLIIRNLICYCRYSATYWTSIYCLIRRTDTVIIFSSMFLSSPLYNYIKYALFLSCCAYLTRLHDRVRWNKFDMPLLIIDQIRDGILYNWKSITAILDPNKQLFRPIYLFKENFFCCFFCPLKFILLQKHHMICHILGLSPVEYHSLR